jgi:acyl-CoA synthetase (NDP forming)
LSEKITDEPYKKHFLYNLLNPKSIAVFGANNDLMGTMGSMQLRNILAGSDLRDNIYPIHPRLEIIQGLKAYKSIFEIPVVPDLAFLILPTRVVPEVMEECGQKGIKNLIITSGGFREIGEEGKKLSQDINSIAKKYDMRFIGPNCLGVYNGWLHYPEKRDAFLNTFWPYVVPEKGSISICSQSGSVAAQLGWHARDYGIKIGRSLSVGNENNVDTCDILEFFRDDPQTEVIGLYIEEVKRGRTFIQLIKEISPLKPIVAIYAGGTEAGNRSIMSHTGSIAGNQKIYDNIFKEAGVTQTNSIFDFMFYLRTFAFAQKFKIYPKGKKVAVVSNSGGPGSMMTKNLELNGLIVPEFSDELKLTLLEDVPSTGSANNPIDVTFDNSFTSILVDFPKTLMKSGEIDSIVVFGVFDFDEVMEVLESSGTKISDEMKKMKDLIPRMIFKPIKRLMKKYSVPVFYAGPFPYKYHWSQMFIRNNVPFFTMWDDPPKNLAVLTKYSQFRQRTLKKKSGN